MNLRDERQREFADLWLNSNRKGILHIAPRMGKTRIGILIMNDLKLLFDPEVLIVYPDNKIRKSWEEEFEKMDYVNPNITFTTHLSLKKYVNNEYDLIILDEIHLLSENQIMAVMELLKLNKTCLGLSGTLSSSTEKYLKRALNLPVLASYPIEQAIREGVIKDYEITVHKVPLSRTLTFYVDNQFSLTEKERFDRLSYVIIELEKKKKDSKFLRLKRMRIIQNSVAKLNKTKELLLLHKEERVLAFCGITKIADSLGIPSYHSKSTEKAVFRDFVEGRIKQLAVCKIGQTGITYSPLSISLINFFDSNPQNLTQKILRAMSFEYDNPEQKARIYIVSSDEPTELNWLSKALEFFETSKIKYV